MRKVKRYLRPTVRVSYIESEEALLVKSGNKIPIGGNEDEPFDVKEEDTSWDFIPEENYNVWNKQW